MTTKKRLQIHNIGAIEETDITIDKPLTIFFGEPRQGKSTILNCLRWVLGGAFPPDLIRHGQDEAHIQLDDGDLCVRREFYRAKNGEIENRPLKVSKAGKPVTKPVDYLKQFVNPFLLDQNFFDKKNEVDRARYLLEILGADTTDVDAELAVAEAAATAARAASDKIGTPTLVPETAPPADSKALMAERNARQEAWQAALVKKAKREREIAEVEAKRQDLERQAAQTRQLEQAAVQERDATGETSLMKAVMDLADANGKEWRAVREEYDAQIAELTRLRDETLKRVEQESLEATAKLTADFTGRCQRAREALVTLSATMDRINAERAALPALEPLPQPVFDTADLDQKIADAGAQAAAYARYQDYLAHRERKREAAKIEAETTERVRELRKRRLAKLSQFCEGSPVAGLRFTEEGRLLYEDTDMAMLSTSQIMRLSSSLAKLYPEGLGVELLDRGESLGRSIYGLIKEAKERRVSILAAVVGEKPAVIEEDADVFVVEKGKVS